MLARSPALSLRIPFASALRAERPLRRYLWATVIVLSAAMLALFLYETFAFNRLVSVVLAGVMVVSAMYGKWPALYATALGYLSYDYLLEEPRFLLQVSSLDDVLTAFLFLSVGVVTGVLAERLQAATRRSVMREKATARLFEASRVMARTGDADTLAAFLAASIAGTTGRDAVVVCNGKVWDQTGPLAASATPPWLGEINTAELPQTVTRGEWQVRALASGDRVWGWALWTPGEAASPEGVAANIADIMVDVGAAAIARALVAAEKSETDIIVKAEKTRNALLSSISHDLRTPLAAILASATSLAEYGDRFEPSVRADLLMTIQEEAVRLNGVVANLLSMSKLEGGGLKVDLQPVEVAELVDRVVRRMAKLHPKIQLSAGAPTEDLRVVADPILLDAVLSNLIDNAVAASPHGAAVNLQCAASDEGRVDICVVDEGRGIAPEERILIFEKFYRSPTSNYQGSGLGLSIAKGLVEAMEGEVTAESRPDLRGGSVMRVRLQRAASE